MQSYPDFQAEVIYDGKQRQQFEKCRVHLEDESIRFQSRDVVKNVDLSTIFDIRVGQPPLAVAEELHSETVTIGVREDPGDGENTQDFYFINTVQSDIWVFGEALYRAVLNGTELAVRHPTEIGGRRTNSAFSIGTLQLADRSVGFTDIDVPFKVDIESIIDFSTHEQELLGDTRDVIEVTYVRNGRSIVFEAAISLDRKHYILGRYLRLEYSKILRELQNIDISAPETKALAVLYSMRGESKLQTLLNGRSESSLSVLKHLQKRGLLETSEGYVRLTPKGWIIISTQFKDAQAKKSEGNFEKLTV